MRADDEDPIALWGAILNPVIVAGGDARGNAVLSLGDVVHRCIAEGAAEYAADLGLHRDPALTQHRRLPAAKGLRRVR